MDNKDQITLIEIRERLVRIETILEEQDYKAIAKTADDAMALAKKNEYTECIDSLIDNPDFGIFYSHKY